MEAPQTASQTRYLLRGMFGGEERAFVLRPGANQIGSAPEADIHVQSRGVSRRHAVLVTDADGCTIQDLKSKNGVLVNGLPATQARLAVGDELGFGALTLTLVQVERADVDLALELSVPAADSVVSTSAVTSLLNPQSIDELARTIDGFVRRLLVPPIGDLEGALTFLAGSQKLAGACLLEWPAIGPPVVVAAAGAVGDLPALEALRPRLIPGYTPTLRYLASGDLRGAFLERADGDNLGLLTAAGGAASAATSLPSSAALLGILLQLFDRLRPRELAQLPVASSASAASLRLPPGIARGISPAMVAVYRQLEALCRSEISVLISGETGVGKEHLVRALHASSARCSGPFVAVNCAAIPSELLEAEMFGIGKGIATGVEARRGRFVEAHGGTLFLDEIGDMSAALQPKLLRALEEKKITPLGRPAVAVDVRLVAATHTDLQTRLATGRFRPDLYYRLAGYVLEVPPLRRREEDLPLLVGHFVRSLAEENDKRIRGVTIKALRRLAIHPWPGNIRELRNVLRRLVCLCPNGQAIDAALVAQALDQGASGLAAHLPLSSTSLAESLQALERRMIQRALIESGGNQSQAARLLKISRNGLAKRLRRLDIDPHGAAFE